MMKARRPLAVVAVSGGLDSCVSLAIAAEEYEPAMLHLQYGQRTEKRELKSFNDIADYYGVRHQLVTSLPHFKKVGGSSLTDFSLALEDKRADLNKIPLTYVPFRNASILSVATSWAEVIGAQKIFIGAVWEDSSGYPDCRAEFFSAFNEVIREGTKPETEIIVETPIIHFTKSDIVRRAIELNAPIHLTWSCYTNSDLACGVCESCRIRLKGFKDAGKDDPISYVEETDSRAPPNKK